MHLLYFTKIQNSGEIGKGIPKIRIGFMHVEPLCAEHLYVRGIRAVLYFYQVENYSVVVGLLFDTFQIIEPELAVPDPLDAVMLLDAGV